MIEIVLLIETALFHGTYFLIRKAPIYTFGVGSGWDELVFFSCFPPSSKNLSITTPMLWWMEWIKGFCMLLCIVATCTLRAFWMFFRTLIRNSLVRPQSVNCLVRVSRLPQFRIRKSDIFGVEKWSFDNCRHIVTRADRFFSRNPS